MVAGSAVASGTIGGWGGKRRVTEVTTTIMMMEMMMMVMHKMTMMMMRMMKQDAVKMYYDADDLDIGPRETLNMISLSLSRFDES